MLMTHQPTRGPWELSDKSPFLVIGFEPRLYPDQERCTVARVDPNGDKLPEEISKANARLIAASPELLDALKAVAYWMSDAVIPCCFPRQTILDAIAKAEGTMKV